MKISTQPALIKRPTRLLVSAIFSLVLAGVAASSQPALAGDDGSASIFTGLMDSLGFNPPPTPPHISYLERPPLVVPPKMDLPPPQRSAARSNPAWPKDPDAAKPKTSAVPGFLSLENYAHQSSQAELRAHRLAPGTPTAAVHSSPCDYNPEGNACTMASWSDLKARKLEVPNQLEAGKEPTREDLTDPPAGYRAATKTVNATRAAPVVEDNSPLAFIKQQNGQ